MRNVFAACMMLFLSGCATNEIIELGPDRYTVIDSSALLSEASVRKSMIKKAAAQCKASKKYLHIIKITTTDCLGCYTEGNMDFSCLDEYKEHSPNTQYIESL